MRSDAVLQNLLALYAGLTLLNVVFAAALWRSTRDATLRTLFIAWSTVMVSCAGQSVLVTGSLAVTLGFSLVFLNNAAFAHLLAGIAGVNTPWAGLVWTYVGGVALSCLAAAAGAGFTLIALPTALAVATPSVVVSAMVFRRRWGTLTTQGRLLTLSCLLFSAHNLDFPFLRMRESFASHGFTLALLVAFALSICAPAALLEQVARRQALLSAQLDIARALQQRLVPEDAVLEELDFAAHMRPAETVGGDYLHRFRTRDADWFFVMDVAGHGFGAGLIALMAHSTVASIIEARPDAAPRELNDLANRILCKSLEQLGERRFMTVVSARHDRAVNRLVVSGSHEDLLVYRSGSARVERIPVAHLPLGLGFGRVDAEQIGEVSIPLAPGDLVFIGTDGVFEAPRAGDHHLGQFGPDRVAEVLMTSDGVPLQALKARLLEALEAFTGGSYEDDVAFLMLRARRELAA
jgi:serine phosphatase RsbU (regulator of sigma subunit)